MNKEYKHCPICGTLCTIEGDDKEGTHYYMPIADAEIDRLKAEIERLKKALHDCEADHQHWEACKADMDVLRAENDLLKTNNAYIDLRNRIIKPLEWSVAEVGNVLDCDELYYARAGKITFKIVKIDGDGSLPPTIRIRFGFYNNMNLGSIIEAKARVEMFRAEIVRSALQNQKGGK